MNVLMLSPGFPAEMAHFTRGLAEVGATVIGLGDQPPGALPEEARRSLAKYVQVGSFADHDAMLGRVQQLANEVKIDRVECLWEPLMIPAARMRELLGLPGMTVEETVPFRDKEVMKERLDAAGIRTPRHARANTVAECREGAERVGFPLIIKPIDGAGSQDTYRIDSARELENVFGKLGHISEVTIEEFIDGEDCTFDTVCINGEVAYHNIAYYRPRALIGRENPWISQQTICRRDVDGEWCRDGAKMGFDVHKVLPVGTGFTHMEWYRMADGEAVFGEIAARPAGVRTVDLMNFACDIDLYTGWAEAVCWGKFTQNVERRYHSA
ncbi:MAG: ATP-grasp domain-containing protein, partial [Gemmatimonadetes bacterium]|nr:ATP-grasp domain-containing protein [Gemmatimonadota bacterium]